MLFIYVPTFNIQMHLFVYINKRYKYHHCIPFLIKNIHLHLLKEVVTKIKEFHMTCWNFRIISTFVFWELGKVSA